VGISFEESYGKMTIINLMVGGPAFNSKQITKGDEVLAIDGMRDLRGHQISDALKGSNIAGTKVTLTIKKRQTGEIEDVPLARVLTASIADKRKLFDIFTNMANRANQDQVLSFPIPRVRMLSECQSSFAELD
jgi:C-terminal processing protease CtpA/Prc